MRNMLFAVIAVFTFSSTVDAQPFFQDNFDNGSRTNANGFTWTAGGGNVTVSDQQKFSGTHALRFRFPAKPNCEDAMAEQRFNMGRYLPEIWVEYMIFIPANFKHRDQSVKNKVCPPSTAADNNKFLLFWRDKYFGDTDSTWAAGWEYIRINDTTSRQRFYARRSVTNAVMDQPYQPQPIFISKTGPLVIGQWNKVQVRLKASSVRGVKDGIVQIRVNDKMIMNITTADFHNFGTRYPDAVLRNGYFMGWSNSGFTEETVFYVDDVKFYDKNPDWK